MGSLAAAKAEILPLFWLLASLGAPHFSSDDEERSSFWRAARMVSCVAPSPYSATAWRGSRAIRDRVAAATSSCRIKLSPIKNVDTPIRLS
jgi:hypothetical protein